MFDNLQDRLSHTLKRVAGNARLTEDNIKSTLRDVRIALLEADVALSVVTSFVEGVREKALGAEVSLSLNPRQQFLKIVEGELISLMGDQTVPLNLAHQPPVMILLAGLQGAGKTATAIKLARYLVERDNRKPLLVSADVYRPAAIEQLRVLAEEADISVCSSSQTQKPVTIVEDALAQARRQFADVLIVDTAGRLAVDDEMMAEIGELQSRFSPHETLFVIDAMTGQDAINTARTFDEVLNLTGVVLTKVDGDARGGAALSVRHVTGKPIKFMGVGEKIDALEPFHPERIASRILGMGDMMSLIEDIELKVDKKKAERLARKMSTSKGRGFDLEDMLDQFLQMRTMGGMGAIMKLMPGMSGMSQMMEQKGTQNQFGRMEAIINSMTPQERRNPDILNGSRKRRITKGSGTNLQDMARLLKQFKQMQKMMKKMGSKKGMGKMMQALGGSAAGAGPMSQGLPMDAGLPGTLGQMDSSGFPGLPGGAGGIPPELLQGLGKPKSK